VGQDFCFYYCLKQIFLGTTKFGEHKKILGEMPPNAPPWQRTWPGVDFITGTVKTDPHSGTTKSKFHYYER